MDRYALIDNAGNVVNVCAWDGVKPWEPPPGLLVVKAPPEVGPGATYVDGKFTPGAPPQPPPTPEELRLAKIEAEIEALKAKPVAGGK